jgi:glyoxylase-like metal-dependent hydrolase (beta-lactamase superfamily II)
MTRLFVLDMGTMGTDRASMTGVIPITDDARERPAEWIQIPSLVFLVDHPDAGWVLFDTGCHPDGMRGHWPRGLRRHAPYQANDSQNLISQLRLVGIGPTDISTVVVSHLHFDHAGNIGAFVGTAARIIVHRDEFAEALIKTHEGPRPYAAGYVGADFDIDELSYDLVDDNCVLAPGLEVLQLPGHTPGTIGLKVELDELEVLMPSDAVYTRWNLDNPDRTPATCHDTIGYRNTLMKLRKWESVEGRRIMFTHDADDAMTYRFAPDHY